MISPFATDAEYITQAYFHVMARTTIAPDLQKMLLPEYIHGHQSGNPRLEIAALAPLIEAEWQWPEFDMWAAEFERVGQWPYMWKDLDIASLITDRESKKFKSALVQLLWGTLGLSVYRCRDGYKEARVNWFTRNGWYFPSIKCPVEDNVAEQLKDQVKLDDWRTWPPFFPGDRTSIQGNRWKRTTPII